VNGDRRGELAQRREEVYEAIRIMEQDLRDGTLDRMAYLDARRRYEAEAARLLQQEDALSGHTLQVQPKPRRRRGPIALTAVTVVALLLAVALFLTGAVRARTGNAAITGDIGAATATASTPPTELIAALNLVQTHPRDISAQLTLAQAYEDAGQVSAAAGTFRQAIALDPHGPEARTQYAMFEGSTGHNDSALRQLSVVESDHPGYARAWLVDGLIASRTRQDLPRAIRSWQRFLKLSPHASIAPQVRALVRAARTAEKKSS
jgi:cytochrome c-type biogenesis protein CcmH/NrfG